MHIAITPGEPSGIGPDLCLLFNHYPADTQFSIIADPALFSARAVELGISNHIESLSNVSIEPIELTAPSLAGTLNIDNARYVIRTLDRAIEGLNSGEYDALVTGPVHKGIINESGLMFSGHTEYLADHTGGNLPVMLLATGDFRVALATTHIPLRQVADAITPEIILAVSRILHQDLQQRFGIQQPRILVCGLNPHAGEDGHLGDEEIRVITPALNALRAEGINVVGPLPADTLFTKHHLNDADAVLAMYHDQGLPVLKYAGFGAAANITLGLPVIRTSVDHGTALDLAGTGNIDLGSFGTAIEQAITMVHSKNTQLRQHNE